MMAYTLSISTCQLSNMRSFLALPTNPSENTQLLDPVITLLSPRMRLFLPITPLSLPIRTLLYWLSSSLISLRQISVILVLKQQVILFSSLVSKVRSRLSLRSRIDSKALKRASLLTGKASQQTRLMDCDRQSTERNRMIILYIWQLFFVKFGVVTNELKERARQGLRIRKDYDQEFFYNKKIKMFFFIKSIQFLFFTLYYHDICYTFLIIIK